MKRILFIFFLMAFVVLFMLTNAKAIDNDDYVRSLIRERQGVGYVYFSNDMGDFLFLTQDIQSVTVSGSSLVIANGTVYDLVDVGKISNTITTQATTETILSDLTTIKQIYSNIDLTLYGLNLSPLSDIERGMSNEQALSILLVVALGTIIVKQFSYHSS